MPQSHIIITHQYPLNAPGGGTRSCVQIIQHLQKIGVEVTVIQISSDSQQGTDLVPCQVFSVAPNHFNYLFTGYSIARTIEKLISQKSVDAVLSWSYEAAFLPKFLRKHKILFGMIAAMPSYEDWFTRKTDFKFLKGFSDNWFRLRPFRLADISFVSSNFTKRELSDLFDIELRKISVVGRGIDDVFFSVNRTPSKSISNFIFYGSLAPVKGVFDVVDALGFVYEKGFQEWKLKIAGWGDLDLLTQSIREHGIEDNVQFLGRLEPNELVQSLGWADIAILPSRAESFGRSIAEAQAAGLPVISYAVGSIPEIVDHGSTGWLVPPKQPKLLAEAIVQAIKQPAATYQMGLAGRERVSQLFSWEKTAGAILHGIENARRSNS
ncbi:MAG: glycosyltransferase family 4 protein [Tildeniella torsiva UHER 1998/13D]|jgi:glycosyltransferase involved in cell wall biosynthesis|nr:glycosyltransferase family 4 protein [Tildeniella torsiva UHER 1998/13D]